MEYPLKAGLHYEIKFSLSKRFQNVLWKYSNGHSLEFNFIAMVDILTSRIICNFALNSISSCCVSFEYFYHFLQQPKDILEFLSLSLCLSVSLSLSLFHCFSLFWNDAMLWKSDNYIKTLFSNPKIAVA